MIAALSETESFTLPDNRTLSYALYGSPVPRTTLIYSHSTPSSRLEGKLWHAACVKHHIRLIAPDRPGCGLSTFQRNRSVLDWPADVLALLDHLKIHEFYILGVGSGAAYALAGVWSVGERLRGVSVIGACWNRTEGMGGGMVWRSRVVGWLASWMHGLSTVFFESMLGRASRDPDPMVFEDLLSREVGSRPPAEQDLIRDPANWPSIVAMTRESFHKGSEGASWEARLQGSDWGFELSNLKVGEHGVPLSLWHGMGDTDCSATLASKAHGAMPGSVLHLQDGEGHISYMLRDADAILMDLLGEKESIEVEEYMMVGY
ncbi:alpha/beta hydrolase fold domain-containing protein [Plenodomus tracheiphilus IPT5]|uniref:Alpha/beta hydrolase fold domain-containing protein n=1 Tax=Plenodomus tracheiphilus IPT5 TaxID=1408161 RepID=A0A6A7BD31_9PLEO|nr:alpha/beta hydrolase fold domain-containing protein [Plenodomus tracheiphilus IPT5]